MPNQKAKTSIQDEIEGEALYEVTEAEEADDFLEDIDLEADDEISKGEMESR